MFIMKEYKILESPYAGELVALVNAAIKMGWQPVGGVATTYIGTFHQALVR